MKKQIILVLSLILLSNTTFALETPKRSPLDSRIRNIDYNKSQVTLINAHYGYTTHIELASNETISDVAIGDSEAWACQVRQNHIFLKPIAEEANTNMSVLTDNNRIYIFDLRAYNASEQKEKYYLISFNYPEDEAKRIAEDIKAAEIKQALDNENKFAPTNYNYWKLGYEDIAPTKAYDNGVFTYLYFPANRDFPAVYKENLDGTEALVNNHVEDNIIVVHGIFERLVLRKGNLATLIINANYNPDGVYNDTGMTIQGYKRVTAGE